MKGSDFPRNMTKNIQEIFTLCLIFILFLVGLNSIQSSERNN